MSVTATVNVSLNTNASIASFLSKGGKLEFGTLAFDSSMPSTGEDLSFSMKNCEGAVISTYDGYVFEYDVPNTQIYAYKQSSNVNGALTAYSGTLASLSNVPYMAWGWG